MFHLSWGIGKLARALDLTKRGIAYSSWGAILQIYSCGRVINIIGRLFWCLLQPMDLDDVLSSRDSEDEVDEEELQQVDLKVAGSTLASCVFCISVFLIVLLFV
jgi:hypothetical protein